MAPGSGFLSTLHTLRLRLLRRQEDAGTRELADFLATVALFAPMSRSMLLELAEAMHERSYSRDETVYHEGDPGIGLYIIRKGSVRLLAADREGQAHEIRTAEERDLLGIAGVLGGGTIRRTETAQATAETRLLGLFIPELRTLQRRHPKTAATVVGQLARQLALTLAEARSLRVERDGPVAAARQSSEAHGRAANRQADLPLF